MNLISGLLVEKQEIKMYDKFMQIRSKLVLSVLLTEVDRLPADSRLLISKPRSFRYVIGKKCVAETTRLMTNNSAVLLLLSNENTSRTPHETL